MRQAKSDLDRIAVARRCLAKVHQKLLCPTPASLAASTGDLEVAIECLRNIETKLVSESEHVSGVSVSGGSVSGGSKDGPRPVFSVAFGQRVELFRTELAGVNTLLAGAAKFYEGWARLLAESPEQAEPNYDHAGRSGPGRLGRTEGLSIRG